MTYTSKYNNTALNFNTAYPIIDTEYRIDVNNQRTIAWTDNLNTPRLINIDNASAITNIQQLNIFQDVSNPSISSSSINDSGGALPSGAIILLTKYKSSLDNSQTNWFVHDHVFYINPNSKNLAFNLDDGGEGGLVTSKSISVTFAGCDTRYDTLEIGYIKSKNGVVSAYKAVDVTNTSTTSFTLTGNESVSSITLEEILVATTSYNTAATLTQLAGRLFMANLTADPMPALQQAALSINITWSSALIDVTTNFNNHKDNLPPTLLPGEVYALYLGVELNKGGWRLYHIPGRAPAGTDRDVITNEGMTYKKFQVEDTISSNNMGYWENQGETYPNTSDFNNGSIDLRNQPVRHHRLPTLSYLAHNTYLGTGTFGVTQLPVLNISASNVVIPGGIQSQIKRWKIFYAKKKDSDSIFLGSDLLQYPAIPQDNPSIRWSSGGNWTMDAYYSSGGSDLWLDFVSIDKGYIRGHSLDYLYNKSNTVPTYAEFCYKLARTNLQVDYTGFRSTGARLSWTGGNFPTPGGGTVASAIIDYTVPASTTITPTTYGRKSLDNFFYLPQNAQNGIHKSLYNEGVFVATINNPDTTWITHINLFTRATNGIAIPNNFSAAGTVQEETMLMHYSKLLTSVHTTFDNQITIPMEGYGLPSATSQSFQGGDGFINYLSFSSIAPICANPDSGNVGRPNMEGVRIWRGYIGYSRHNFNYRHQTSGNITTYYHGKTDVRTLFNPVVPNTGPGGNSYNSLVDANVGINVIEYNIDYNQLNEYNATVTFSPTLVEETIFPNTVIFSPVQSEESKATSWRTFLSADRFVLYKNKGQITNLQGLNNRQLLLHTEFSLFRTRTDIQVATANTSENVFLRSANIFDLPPEEVLPVTSGYAGTQNKQACILTKAGYFFVDNNQGKAFLYSGQLEEISSNGLRNFFKDFMQISPNSDNAFTSSGYTAGYDERNNRLILSKKNDTTSWTISYNPSNKTWISYHDYIPDDMFNTVDNVLYSVKANKFYLHNVLNSTAQKGVYYDATINPSYIDVPFTKDAKDKLYTSVNWMTELYPSTYISGQPSSTLSYSNTFTHITLRSLDHCTGRLSLSSDNNFTSLYTSNLRNLGRTWYFNNIRDIVVSPGFVKGFYNNYDIDITKLDTNPVWYNERRFIDKFLICRLEYDNIQNNRCLLVDTDVEFNYTPR